MSRDRIALLLFALSAGSVATAAQSPTPKNPGLRIVDEDEGVRLAGAVGTGVAWLRQDRDEILYGGLPEEKVRRIPVDWNCRIARGARDGESVALLAAIHREGRDRLLLWRPVGDRSSRLALPVDGQIVGLDLDVSQGELRALVFVRGTTDSCVILRSRSAAETEVEAIGACPEGMRLAGSAQFGDSRTVVALMGERKDPDAPPSLTMWKRVADRWTTWKTVACTHEGPDEDNGFGGGIAVIRDRDGSLAGVACGIPWLRTGPGRKMTGGIALYDKSLRAIATVAGDEELDELGLSCTAIADQTGTASKTTPSGLRSSCGAPTLPGGATSSS